MPPRSLSLGALGAAAAHMPCAYKTTVLYGFARPSPPRALAVAALALRRLALRSVRGAAAVGVRTAAIALLLQTFHFIFLPAPLDTRLSLCYNHRRTDGVRLDRFHFITKRRDLSSPVFLFFSALRVARPPDHPVFGLVEGGRGVCLAVALCCVGWARAAPRSRLAFGAGRLWCCFCRRLSLDYTPPRQGSRRARAARP